MVSGLDGWFLFNDILYRLLIPNPVFTQMYIEFI